MAMSFFVRFLAVLTLFFLISCGGGGGDSSGNLSVSTTATELSLDYEQDGIIPSIILPVLVTGTPEGDVYLGWADESGWIESVELTYDDARPELGNFVIFPKAGLEAGSYSGEISILFCKDELCNNHYRGSPITVPYRFHVMRTLQLSASMISVTTSPESAPATQQLSFVPGELVPLVEARIANAESAPWLVMARNGNSLDLTIARMPPGNRSANIELFNPANQAVLATVPVNYQVTSTDQSILAIKTNPEMVNFSAAEGFAAGSQDVLIEIPSWASGWIYEVRYGSNGGGWLNVQRLDDTHLRLAASAVSLNQGQYSATIHLESTGLESRTLDLPVSLNAGSGFALPNFFFMPIKTTTITADLAKEVAVVHADGRKLGWSATSNKPWLKLTRSSGVSGVDSLRFEIPVDAIASLPDFALEQAWITLTIANQPEPFLIAVQAVKSLPTLISAMPVGLPVGIRSSLVVNAGFSEVDFGRYLKLSNATLDSWSDLGTGTIKLNVTPQSAGPVEIRIENALGLEPARLAVTATTPPAAVSHHSAVGYGFKRRPFYDSVRKAFWLASPSEGKLRRYALVNGSWTVSEVSANGLIDATLLANGRYIAVLKYDRLDRIYPETMDLAWTSMPPAHFPGSNDYFFNPVAGSGIVALNDGSLRMTLGSSGWSEAVWTSDPFDPFNSFGGTSFGLNTYTGVEFYEGPRYIASANGEEALLDAPGGLIRVQVGQRRDSRWLPENMGESTFLGSYSQDASRLLLQCQTLYNENLAYMGRIPLEIEPNHFLRSCVLAPDGRRVYVFAEHYPDGRSANMLLDTSTLPRVYVFDAVQRPEGTDMMPLLGYFELPYHVNNSPVDDVYLDGYRGAEVGLGVDSAGTMLMVAGNSGVVIHPIPATLTTATSMHAARAGRGTVQRIQRQPTLWKRQQPLSKSGLKRNAR